MSLPTHVRLLSRTSALALLQATLVRRAIVDRWPDIRVEIVTQSSAGDRDRRAALWAASDKGLFTSDLSRALVNGAAEAAVHSWKDLPIEAAEGTRVAATIERADPRDVLLVRRTVAERRPSSITVLSSSPRRAWQIQETAPALLPWHVSAVTVAPVRGNVPTRLDKLVNGDGDALIVAKAALDRLLSPDAPDAARAAVRAALDRCRWMVLPVKTHPTAPAQGAVAVEVASSRPDVIDLFSAINHEPTWTAVHGERRILASFGGGCHEAVGATVLPRSYGRVTSIRARVNGTDISRWELENDTERPPHAPVARIWPRPGEPRDVRRASVEVTMPEDGIGFRVARADALPAAWNVSADRFVWVAGDRTWEKLARRGIWVHGSSEGLGDDEAPAVDALGGRAIEWRRLTHSEVNGPDVLATYTADETLPADLDTRSHFFWTSGVTFRRAVERFPAIRAGWHASGPGRTARAIREILGGNTRTSVWLDYDEWHRHVTS